MHHGKPSQSFEKGGFQTYARTLTYQNFDLPALQSIHEFQTVAFESNSLGEASQVFLRFKPCLQSSTVSLSILSHKKQLSNVNKPFQALPCLKKVIQTS